MLEQRLRKQLQQIEWRARWLRLGSVLCVVWLVGALLAAAVAYSAEAAVSLPANAAFLLGGSALLIAFLAIGLTLRGDLEALTTARRIEARYPELNTRLLAAVAQNRDVLSPQLGYLQTMLLGETLEHGHRTGWSLIAPRRRAVTTWLVQYLLLAAFSLLLVLVHHRQSQPHLPIDQALSLPASKALQYSATIEPGNTEIERGSSLLVLARFGSELPADVTLGYQSSTEPAAQQTMTKSLDDPVFAGRLNAVTKDLEYWVEYPGQVSPKYRVTVFDYPELERADVKLAFPTYTGQSETLIEDTRQATAVEGTQVTLVARLNKEVATAKLIDAQGKATNLTADPEQPRNYVATWPLVATQRYKLELVDQQGRKSKQSAEFVFTAVPNRAPEIKLVFPARDVQVSPLEELELQATVWDDFGVLAYGIAYTFAGQPSKEVLLGEKKPGRQKHEARQALSFESLAAEPDQLLSYYFFAEDAGADGKTRRTASDMFFCEVRHFDEIFRQGEPPPGGSSGQPDEAVDKLAELQKEVINATWKILRRESAAQPGPDFARDAAELLAGEQAVVALADEAAKKLRNPESQSLLQVAREQMLKAIEHLKQTIEPVALAPLKPALAAEQAAYQALLKLRAREHMVVRSNKSQGKGSSKRSSEQLSQLELKESDNRYEEQRTADKQEDEAQQEARQVLSRLRELARRQEDLNQQIKELQTALEAAQTEAAREEVRQQLKRLRTEEQQILRDADELRNRMDQPANQQRMAEAKQQLDQTRAQVQQASEALQAGQASQAAAAGARAEQQLEKLREDFRKQTAGRFNEEMVNMRDEARRLDEREQTLGQKLAEHEQAKTLRESTGREELRAGFEQQRQKFDKLVEEMSKTIEEAETSEPLLAKRLYDTVREARQQRSSDALEMTRQLLERGFVDQSRQAEKTARAGIERLRTGVERAAESVLGDEAEALRQARDAVDQLARAIDNEMRRATGNSEPAEGKGDQQAGKSPNNDTSEKSDGGKEGARSENSKTQPTPAQGNAAQGNQGAGRATDNTPSEPGKSAAKGPGDKPAGQAPSDAGKPTPQPGAGNAPDKQGKPGEGQPGQSQSPGDKPGEGDSKSPQSKGDSPGKGAGEGSGKGSGEETGKAAGQGGKPGSAGTPSKGGSSSGSPTGGGGASEKTTAQSLLESFGGTSGPQSGPLTGNDFRPWADRLRDVEEMIDDPKLRAEAAQIRDRAAAMRAEFKRHAHDPNWDLVRESISRPLAELRQRLSEELLKRQSSDALVPLDRDPVPPKYSDQVRQYYERLGAGQ